LQRQIVSEKKKKKKSKNAADISLRNPLFDFSELDGKVKIF
jgi:hypothetical protein